MSYNSRNFKNYTQEVIQKELNKAGNRRKSTTYPNWEKSVEVWVLHLLQKYFTKDDEKIYKTLEKIKKKLVKFDPDKENLYQYIIKNIKDESLSGYGLMNKIGENWIPFEHDEVQDKAYDEQMEKVNKYIADTCSLRGFGNNMGEIWAALNKELQSFDPNRGTLGAFLSSRITNREKDVYRKKKQRRSKTYTIPDECKIEIPGSMELFSVKVAEMKQQNEPIFLLEKGWYRVDEDLRRILFSPQDIGKKITLEYCLNVNSLENEGELVSQVNVEQQYRDLENFRLKMIAMTAMILCFDTVYNWPKAEEDQKNEKKEKKDKKTGKRSQQRKTKQSWRERSRICFTERLINVIHTSAALLEMESDSTFNTLQVNAYHAIDSLYMDFVMAGKCTTNIQMKEFFQKVRETELKTYGDIGCDRNKNKQIEWNDKKTGNMSFFPLEVPVAFSKKFSERYMEAPFSNGTVSQFRKNYTNLLISSCKKWDDLMKLYEDVEKEPDKC